MENAPDGKDSQQYVRFKSLAQIQQVCAGMMLEIWVPYSIVTAFQAGQALPLLDIRMLVFL